MYKCGWQGCEKAYGTLNHLNAHVTMQSHGAKRTPEGRFLKLLFSRAPGFIKKFIVWIAQFLSYRANLFGVTPKSFGLPLVDGS
jgi:hypothetical protein